MNGNTSGPVASRLVFLSDLQKLNIGDKFSQSVERYNISAATLILKHAYPTNSTAIANVNVDHVLESLQATDTHTGAWVNIIGYITPAPVVSDVAKQGPRGKPNTQMKAASGSGELVGKRKGKARDAGMLKKMEEGVHVQAVMLWSAGVIKLGSYELAVEKMHKALGVG
ncbi:hypothetical protein B0A49_08977 [Cryomyces minteri]|uniref:Uncharacterized protein n=1 Tax=Cryomyces minteri TaxID=331657 RepID=A0A4U0WP52_9PEZI|nr:hypothetical protein B0A49_08977 [Cryomyces minteri]